MTATTSAVAQFYQRGELDLDMPIMDPYLLGPRYGGQGKVRRQRCFATELALTPARVALLLA